MAINFKKLLLTGTALVAISYAAQAQAAVVNISGADQLAIAADPNATPAVTFTTDHVASFNDTVNITGTVTAGGASQGTLTLIGTSTVSGAVGVNGANLVKVINAGATGKTATFSSTVDATTLNVSGTGTVALGGNTGAAIAFAGNDGLVTLASGKAITGTVDATANVGTLTLSGGTQSVSGNIGATAALKVINAGQAAGATTLGGTVAATTINVGTGSLTLNGAATVTTIAMGTSDGTVTLADTKNITGAVDTTTASTGTLTLSGTSTVSGAVGSTAALKVINAGATGKTATFSSAVKATALNFSADGNVAMNGDFTGAVGFAANDGVLTVADTKNITGTVDATTASKGTLTLAGTTTVSGAVGSTAALKVVNGAANGKTSTFSSTVNAATIKATGTGDFSFGGNVTGALDFDNKAATMTFASGKTLTGTATSTGGTAGILTFAGGTQSVSGAISALTTVNGAANGATTTFSSTVAATNIKATGTGTMAFSDNVTGGIDFDNKAATMTLASGKTVTGTIDSTGGANGTFTFSGGTQSVSSNVGAGAAIATINAGQSGGATTFGGTVAATTLNVGTGSVTLNGATTAAIAMAANDGTVTIADTKNLTGTVDATTASKGTLTLSGTTTVSGTVGATAALKAINAGATGKTATFSSAVKATALNFSSDGNVAMNGDFTGAVAFAANDGVLTVADTKNITGTVDATTASKGTLTLAGTTTVSGAVGSTAALKVVNAGIAGKTGTFSGAVKAATINVTGTGTVAFGGAVTATTLSYAAAGTATLAAGLTGAVDFNDNDGTLTVASGQTVTGAINNAAGAGNKGTLTLSGGTQTIAGAVGATQSLKVVNAGAASATSTFSSTVAATTVNVTSTGSVAFNGNVTGNLVFAANGTATIADTKTLTGSINGTGGVVGTGVGNIVFGGTSASAVTTIGDTGILKSLTINDAAAQKTVTTSSNVLAADTNSLNDNILAVTGTYGIGAAQTLNSTISTTTVYGKVTSTGAATVNANSKLGLTVDSTVFIPDATTFTVVDGTGGAGVGTLAAGKLTVNGVNSGAGQTVTTGIITWSQSVDAANLVIKATRVAADTIATTANADSVGTVMDTIAATGDDDLDTIQGLIQNATTEDEVTDVLESLVPTVDGGAAVAAISVGGQVVGVTDTRMASVRSGDGLTGMAAGASANGATIWFQGYGQAAEQDMRDNVAGYDADTYGGVIGFDSTKLIKNGVLGLAFNYGNTQVDSENVNTTATDVDNYGVTFYGNVDLGNQMFFNGQLGYAYNDIDVVRHDVGGAGNPSANGNTDANQYSVKASFGRDYAVQNGLTLTPVVSAAYAHVSTDGYTETGSLADQVIADSDVDVFNLGLAVNAGWNLKNSDGSTTKPALHVGYTYDAVGDNVSSTSSFVGDPASTTFVTNGPDPAQSTFNAGAGLTWMTTANWDLSANYDYQVKEDFDAHNGTLRASAQF